MAEQGGLSLTQKSKVAGLGNGLIGILIFSASLPATRVAVADFSPVFLTSVRAVIAAVIGICLLALMRQSWPKRSDLVPFAITSIGVVIGFPLLTAFALQHVTAAHSIVMTGLLPLSTAAFGVLRGGQKPKPLFWLFALLGSASVIGFALTRGAETNLIGDSLMLCAVILCGLGYAEGARLTKTYGGWQVISWALIMALPFMLICAVLTWPISFPELHAPSWLGLAYVSVFSMMIGFVFWYRGLAAGGTASVGQLQLLQPFFGLFLAALLLGEAVTPIMIISTVLVVACVGLARKFS